MYTPQRVNNPPQRPGMPMDQMHSGGAPTGITDFTRSNLGYQQPAKGQNPTTPGFATPGMPSFGGNQPPMGPTPVMTQPQTGAGMYQNSNIQPMPRPPSMGGGIDPHPRMPPQQPITDANAGGASPYNKAGQPTNPGFATPGMPPIGSQTGVPQPGQNTGFGSNLPPQPQMGPTQSFGGNLPPQPPMGPIAQQPPNAYSPQNPLSPWPSTPNVGAPMPPQTGAPPSTAQAPGSPGNGYYSSGTQFGGESTVGARAGAADYAGVQGFSDAAYDNSRRYLDPTQQAQDRRFDQELVNKGIDPLSAMGREMADQLSRQQGDQNNAAAFSAMGFGQGIQDQMFGQDLSNRQLAGDMQRAQWQNQNNQANRSVQKYGMDQSFNLGRSGQDLQRYGMDQNFNLGKSGQDLQRYGMDQSYQLGQGQLGLGRQNQDWNEYMDTNGIDFRDAQFNEGTRRFDQNAMMALFGIPQAGVNGGINPGYVGDSVAPWEEFGGNVGDYLRNRGG